ncbi:MAG TPA: glycoside-pentoside-hexuronide (GPH):cation symporter [Niallia sp.]|nr:glycoside-pentoside-hexuronide (GPH):cation symporter [Niallia sp.]
METPETMSIKSINNREIDDEQRLTFREKLAGTLAGFNGTIHSQMIAVFLLFFYTDVMEVSLAYVAGLILVARIIGAISAPIFGIIVDRTSTPWGKFVPWYLILGVPIAIFGWLTFTDFNLSPRAELVYITVTFVIYSILVASLQAPAAAVGPAITKRIDDRISMGQIGYFLVMLAAIFISTGVQPLYKVFGGGNDAQGFSILMGLIGVLCVSLSLFQVTSLKEKYVVNLNKKEDRPSIKVLLKAVFTNKAAIIVYIYVFSINMANGIRSAVMIHYFKYYFNFESLMVLFGIVSLVPTILGVMLSSKVTKRIGLKMNVLACAIVSVLSMASVMFIPNTTFGIVMFLVTSVIASLFLGFASPAQGAMLPAAMDYTEWKSGINVNGFMGSLQGFMQTLSTALAGSIAATGLAFVGYVPGIEQSDETIFGLKMLMGLLPSIVIAFTVCVAFFDLTEEKQAQISKELAERRRQGASNN